VGGGSTAVRNPKENRSIIPWRHEDRAVLFSLIRSDIRQKAVVCYGSDRWPALVKTLMADGTMAMIGYRLMQWSRRRHLAPLEMFFNKFNLVCCNCLIGRGAEFGPGFVLFHSLGVVINGKVRGGSNVMIYHQVTLGNLGHGRCGAPTLGDDVLIGSGAKVLGPVSIGDGARVGANAVILDDLPPHVTAVGNPARIVRRPPQEPPAYVPEETRVDLGPAA
jgi:serine O-acetyltransferase